MKRFTLAALALLAAVSAADAQQTNLGPFTTTITATGSATIAALPSNPTRRAVTICNGSAAQTVTFTTGTVVTPVSLTVGQVLPTGNVVASCFTIGSPAGPQGIAGAQVNVIASASAPVTFFEYP